MLRSLCKFLLFTSFASSLAHDVKSLVNETILLTASTTNENPEPPSDVNAKNDSFLYAKSFFEVFGHYFKLLHICDCAIFDT